MLDCQILAVISGTWQCLAELKQLLCGNIAHLALDIAQQRLELGDDLVDMSWIGQLRNDLDKLAKLT